jgi:hypothetical protein
MRPDVLAAHLADTIRGYVSPLQSAVGDVRARLDVLEARSPLPGPPGPPGPPGRDGVNGKDGAGLRYLGVHVAGKTYDVGDLVTAGGSAWYCGRETTSAPGHSSDWQLMVKRGRDARGDR